MLIPGGIKNIIKELNENGFEAYIVGGCVRDFLIGKRPNDWDITTSAKPEEIQKVFSDSFYDNEFGTVGVKTDIGIVEATTYRTESKYTDKRHPDEVKFAETLEEDLKRRDFTINAMALKLETRNLKRETYADTKNGFKLHDSSFTIIDLFGGQEDLKNKIIRAVGDPEKRFNEDALRMLRAVRFATELSSADSQAKIGAQLDFTIEPKTFLAIRKNAGWLEMIAKERIRDEFIKIMMSKEPERGVELLRETGLLKYVIPELEKGVGVSQNRHHIYTVYEHCLLSLKFAARPPKFSESKLGGVQRKNYNLTVRLSALLHDIAKPQVKQGEGSDATFYNHDYVGAKWAVRILDRLRFSKEIVEQVANLIRNHMFVYDVGAVTEAGVRRLLKRVGPENMKDLIALRVADRLGSGVPKAQPYRLRHFQYMVEKVQHDPISVKMLKINGNDIMGLLSIEPGPIIGAVLDVLLAEVIEDPKKNSKKYLEKRANELARMELVQLRELAKEKIEEKKEEDDTIIKNKYWVK
ncbi:MAG: HD domain-containing protein [Candidatus Portnoybacteria bacterium]|nr:HD domain-containing protein [Candidatus Portnoybacteria bacterium]